MKKTARKKLVLPRKIVRDLQIPELEAVAGGATDTYLCAICGNPRSPLPV